MKELRELWRRISTDDAFRMEVLDAIGCDAVERIRLAVKG